MTGAELRTRRDRLMLTQAELAQRLGVAKNSVARWERGEMAITQRVELLLGYVEADPEVRALASKRLAAPPGS